jgi:hypothetical protein
MKIKAESYSPLTGCLSLFGFAVLMSALLVPASTGQTSNSKQTMSPQFKEQARRAFHVLESLDADDSHVQTHHAHQVVNGLLDHVKTPLDKEVQNILFIWLAEIELAKSAEPSTYRQWMKADGSRVGDGEDSGLPALL